MLTIKFPDKIKTYSISDDYGHTINVSYRNRKWELNIDAQFDGYSYYLERGIVEASSEVELIGETIKFDNTINHSPSHELASHHDEDPDLIVQHSDCYFSQSKQGFIKLTVEGTATVLNEETNNSKQIHTKDFYFQFTLAIDLAIAPDDWEVELAFGLEYVPQEKIDDMDELIKFCNGPVCQDTI